MLDAILRADEAARAWFTVYHSPALDAVMLGLSRGATGAALWFALGLLLVLVRPRTAAGVVQMGLAIALTMLLVDGLIKPVVARARPFETVSDVRVVGRQPVSRSFPSGHAANAFAAGYAFACLVPVARIPIWTLAIAVSVSRIYLGVHYPLDVIAGALIGLACSVFVVGGTRWYSVGSATRTPPVPR
jgi:undecaprenyl-diphosphatase